MNADQMKSHIDALECHIERLSKDLAESQHLDRSVCMDIEEELTDAKKVLRDLRERFSYITREERFHLD